MGYADKHFCAKPTQFQLTRTTADLIIPMVRAGLSPGRRQPVGLILPTRDTDSTLDSTAHKVDETVYVEDLKVTNIYVGNLSFRATEDDVRNAFSAHGEVASVNIIMDRETGRSRGFAFVEMSDENDARSAIEAVNGQEIAGRGVTVNEARPREERPRGGGGGGGRYGDDRGGRRGGGGYGGGRDRDQY